MRTFSAKLTILNRESPEDFAYEEKSKKYGNAMNNGQIKGLFSDILFLTREFRGEPDAVVVVAGSNTGEHYSLVMQMFPDILMWHFWDPKGQESFSLAKLDTRPVKLKEKQKWQFFPESLDGSIVEDKYSSLPHVYLISDIRVWGHVEYEEEFRKTNGYTLDASLTEENKQKLLKSKTVTDQQKKDLETTNITILTPSQMNIFRAKYVMELTSEDKETMESELEMAIWDSDSQIQREIVEKGNFVASSLLFRLPFVRQARRYLESDFVEYLDGDILLQTFTNPKSTETRLIVKRDFDGNYPLRKYNIVEYENKMFTHNVSIREDPLGRHVIWLNDVDGRRGYDPVYELKPTFDCCYMIHILNKYLYLGAYAPDFDIDRRMTQILGIWSWIISEMKRIIPRFVLWKVVGDIEVLPEVVQESSSILLKKVKVPSSLGEFIYQ